MGLDAADSTLIPVMGAVNVVEASGSWASTGWVARTPKTTASSRIPALFPVILIVISLTPFLLSESAVKAC